MSNNKPSFTPDGREEVAIELNPNGNADLPSLLPSCTCEEARRLWEQFEKSAPDEQARALIAHYLRAEEHAEDCPLKKEGIKDKIRKLAQQIGLSPSDKTIQ